MYHPGLPAVFQTASVTISRIQKCFFGQGLLSKRRKDLHGKNAQGEREGEGVLTARGWTASFRLSKILISQNLSIPVGHYSN